MKDTHVKVNDFFTELELPTIPGEDEYPTLEELDAQMRELTDKIEKRIQDAIARYILERSSTNHVI